MFPHKAIIGEELPEAQLKIPLTHTAIQLTVEAGKSGRSLLHGQAPENGSGPPRRPDFGSTYDTSAGLREVDELQSVEAPETQQADSEPLETTALPRSLRQVDETVKTDVDVLMVDASRGDTRERSAKAAPDPTTEKMTKTRNSAVSDPQMQVSLARPHINGDFGQHSGTDHPLLTDRDSKRLAAQPLLMRDRAQYPRAMGQVPESARHPIAPDARGVPGRTRNVPHVAKSDLISDRVSNRLSLVPADREASADPIFTPPKGPATAEIRKTYLERTVAGQMAHQAHPTQAGSMRWPADPTAQPTSSGMILPAASPEGAVSDRDQTMRLQAPTTGEFTVPEMKTTETFRKVPSKSDVPHIPSRVEVQEHSADADLPIRELGPLTHPQMRQVAGPKIGEHGAPPAPQSGAISGEPFRKANDKIVDPPLMTDLFVEPSATLVPGKDLRIDRPAMPAINTRDARPIYVPPTANPRQPVMPTASAAFGQEQTPLEAVQPSSEQIRRQDSEWLGLSRLEVMQTAHGQQSALPHRADLPMQVARQMADAIQGTAQRPVDIALNPEELGRVRLSLSVSESGMVVHVTAERPETLDLMRRHIAELSEQFKQIGYSDINFSFAGGDSQQGDDSMASSSRTPDTPLDPGLEDPADGPSPSVPDSGVDIRL